MPRSMFHALKDYNNKRLSNYLNRLKGKEIWQRSQLSILESILDNQHLSEGQKNQLIQKHLLSRIGLLSFPTLVRLLSKTDLWDQTGLNPSQIITQWASKMDDESLVLYAHHMLKLCSEKLSPEPFQQMVAEHVLPRLKLLSPKAIEILLEKKLIKKQDIESQWLNSVDDAIWKRYPRDMFDWIQSMDPKKIKPYFTEKLHLLPNNVMVWLIQHRWVNVQQWLQKVDDHIYMQHADKMLSVAKINSLTGALVYSQMIHRLHVLPASSLQALSQRKILSQGNIQRWLDQLDENAWRNHADGILNVILASSYVALDHQKTHSLLSQISAETWSWQRNHILTWIERNPQLSQEHIFHLIQAHQSHWITQLHVLSDHSIQFLMKTKWLQPRVISQWLKSLDAISWQNHGYSILRLLLNKIKPSKIEMTSWLQEYVEPYVHYLTDQEWKMIQANDKLSDFKRWPHMAMKRGLPFFMQWIENLDNKSRLTHMDSILSVMLSHPDVTEEQLKVFHQEYLQPSLNDLSKETWQLLAKHSRRVTLPIELVLQLNQETMFNHLNAMVQIVLHHPHINLIQTHDVIDRYVIPHLDRLSKTSWRQLMNDEEPSIGVFFSQLHAAKERLTTESIDGLLQNITLEKDGLSPRSEAMLRYITKDLDGSRTWIIAKRAYQIGQIKLGHRLIQQLTLSHQDIENQADWMVAHLSLQAGQFDRCSQDLLRQIYPVDLDVQEMMKAAKIAYDKGKHALSTAFISALKIKDMPPPDVAFKLIEFIDHSAINNGSWHVLESMADGDVVHLIQKLESAERVAVEMNEGKLHKALTNIQSAREHILIHYLARSASKEELRNALQNMISKNMHGSIDDLMKAINQSIALTNQDRINVIRQAFKQLTKTEKSFIANRFLDSTPDEKQTSGGIEKPSVIQTVFRTIELAGIRGLRDLFNDLRPRTSSNKTTFTTLFPRAQSVLVQVQEKLKLFLKMPTAQHAIELLSAINRLPSQDQSILTGREGRKVKDYVKDHQHQIIASLPNNEDKLMAIQHVFDTRYALKSNQEHSGIKQWYDTLRPSWKNDRRKDKRSQQLARLHKKIKQYNEKPSREYLQELHDTAEDVITEINSEWNMHRSTLKQECTWLCDLIEKSEALDKLESTAENNLNASPQ